MFCANDKFKEKNIYIDICEFSRQTTTKCMNCAPLIMSYIALFSEMFIVEKIMMSPHHIKKTNKKTDFMCGTVWYKCESNVNT